MQAGRSPTRRAPGSHERAVTVLPRSRARASDRRSTGSGLYAQHGTAYFPGPRWRHLLVRAWFAESHSARERAKVGGPYFSEVAQWFNDAREPVRHPHYGRFLRLRPDALVSLTWVNGAGGTASAETLLTVHLDAIAGDVTQVTLTHEGFTTAEARDAHEAAWPIILAGLNTSPRASLMGTEWGIAASQLSRAIARRSIFTSAKIDP